METDTAGVPPGWIAVTAYPAHPLRTLGATKPFESTTSEFQEWLRQWAILAFCSKAGGAYPVRGNLDRLVSAWTRHGATARDRAANCAT
jgi:hypothetical protein